MANEAVIIELGSCGGKPVLRTCADGVGIEKGTLLKLTDPNTASAASLMGEPFAGIAAAEKVANDGSTTIACYTEGVFDLTSGLTAAGNAGGLVCMSGGNFVVPAVAASILSGSIVGKLEETASASEVVRVRLMGC